MIIENECFTNGKYKIGYLFEDSNVEYFNKYLIVTFSAIPAENAAIKHQYSFLHVLKDIPCNKLFIQDSLGEYGTYYMCYQKDYSLAEQVNSLIDEIRIKHSIETRNVICIGSSKGGTAALYHGLLGNFGHAISMGPQLKIASFLNSSNLVHQQILKDMVGDTSQESYQVLDRIIFDLLNKRGQTIIHILTSEKDKQYKEHILPLLKQLDNNSIFNDIIVDNRIQSHSSLSNYNPCFVRSKLFEIFLGMHIDYSLADYKFSNNKINLFHASAELNIKVRTGKDILNSLNISYALSSMHNTIEINLYLNQIFKGLKFAFYLVKGNEPLQKTEYQESPNMSFKVEKGRYRIKYYVRYRDYTISQYTKEIEV